ncbi:RNA-guided endonuclease InsQ/TnpB family protein [Synechococcus sp. R55.2]|uniref:RNA-guided endonuclease InsQ/TnpB family protein n=1 Tax=Synechococcus sp. R55.2 TaxID=2964496 RepID=UPI0039C426E8
MGYEALNIKGVARTRLAKSTYDAGWGQFLQMLAVKAERAGLRAIAVNPNGSSQNCSRCGQRVPKAIQDRWHSCSHCGLELERDHHAAINIKHRAVGHPVLFASAGRSPQAQETSFSRQRRGALTGVTVRVSGTESLKPALSRFSGAERFAST